LKYKTIKRFSIFAHFLAKLPQPGNSEVSFTILKGQVQCFSNQVLMNKCLLQNPENNLMQIRLVVFEKTQKTYTLIPKNDVTKPKARLL